MLYRSWFAAVEDELSTHVEYEPVGSRAGVDRFVAGEVDFGGTGLLPATERTAAVERGVTAIPVAAGAVVVAFNLDGVRRLDLSRQALAGIFLGEITRWDDPEIAAFNPDAVLPARPIRVVCRSDGSGTTHAMTRYLAAISPAWNARHGVALAPEWPAAFSAEVGNDGVAAAVARTAGSIGYVAYGEATDKSLAMARLQNRAGAFVAPMTEACQATLDTVYPANEPIVLPADTELAAGYPLVILTWVLAYERYTPAKRAALQSVLTWCLGPGQSACVDLGYLPLPAQLRDLALERVRSLPVSD